MDFLGGSLTGRRHRLLFENTGNVNSAKYGTFNISVLGAGFCHTRAGVRGGTAPLMGGAAKPCMGGVGEVEGWGKTEEEQDEAQPSILTLKNGRPGAFNDPCVSDTGGGSR